MIFNHINYNFGDATLNNNVMDFYSILVHEFGHVLGLGDIYSSSCTSVSMYGYSSEGQIGKRTLEQSDKNGIRALYGYISGSSPPTTTNAPKTATNNDIKLSIPYYIIILFIYMLY
jgi:hypothetical protein